ncbi:MAG: sulfatase [Planctomycetota bacterium]
MNRREFLKTVIASTATIGLSGMGFPQSKPKSKPNVLFIAIDDLNDWVGCLGGHPDVKTPNLDKLAGRGVNFTNAFCSAPACNPSRASLMTGILPSTSGIYHNSQPWRKALKDAITIPQHFMAHGYYALGSGKIYHGSDPASWNEYWPSKTKAKPPDPLPPANDRPLSGIPSRAAHFDWGPLDVPGQDMGDSKVADWVIKQLQKDWDKPFFLACGFFKPHLPWYVPKKYFDMYPLESITLPDIKEDDLDDVPEIGKQMATAFGDHAAVIEHKQWRKAVQGYLASISFVDQCVGRVIDALDKSNYSNNTIIVLWSDHGWHLGEKLHWRKFALWEEATHNVLMFVAPHLTKPNSICQQPVNLIDIYPTLIDLCRLQPNQNLQGKSLLPLLKNPKATRKRPALTTHGRNNHSLRTKKWRYIRYSDNTEELYDRDTDPLEWNNLAADPKYTKVKKELSEWLPKVNAPDAPFGKKHKNRRKKQPVPAKPG